MEEVEESERPKLVRSRDTQAQAEIETWSMETGAGIASQDAVWDRDTRLEPVSKGAKPGTNCCI